MRSFNSLQLGVLDITDRSRNADLSFSGTAGVSSVLDASKEGVYDIQSDIDCYIAVSEDPSGVTTTTGYPLKSNSVLPIYVPANYKIGVISFSASGTLMIHKSRDY